MEGLISSVCKVNRCPPPSFKPPHQSPFSVTKVLRRSSSMTCPVVLSHRTPFHWQQSSPRHEERRPEWSKKLFLKDVSAFRSLGTQIPPTAPGVVVVFARSKGEADYDSQVFHRPTTLRFIVHPTDKRLIATIKPVAHEWDVMGWGEPTFRGVWDGLVPGEEYSSKIRDQLIRKKLADELVPPGTSERRHRAIRHLCELRRASASVVASLSTAASSTPAATSARPRAPPPPPPP
uniref:Uncharacterized protein n=1 Tax=Oryza glumipatula TaxID=40148 RepID=A0A0D9YBD5_9ORYZ